MACEPCELIVLDDVNFECCTFTTTSSAAMKMTRTATHPAEMPATTPNVPLPVSVIIVLSKITVLSAIIDVFSSISVAVLVSSVVMGFVAGSVLTVSRSISYNGCSYLRCKLNNSCYLRCLRV